MKAYTRHTGNRLIQVMRLPVENDIVAVSIHTSDAPAKTILIDLDQVVKYLELKDDAALPYKFSKALVKLNISPMGLWGPVGGLLLDLYKTEILPIIKESQSHPSLLAHELPGIKMQVKHPVCGTMMDLFSAIIRLNDQDKWTREQIADWIESLDEVPTF